MNALYIQPSDRLLSCERLHGGRAVQGTNLEQSRQGGLQHIWWLIADIPCMLLRLPLRNTTSAAAQQHRPRPQPQPEEQEGQHHGHLQVSKRIFRRAACIGGLHLKTQLVHQAVVRDQHLTYSFAPLLAHLPHERGAGQE